MGCSGAEWAGERRTLSVCGYRPLRVPQRAQVGLAPLGGFPYGADPWCFPAPPTWPSLSGTLSWLQVSLTFPSPSPGEQMGSAPRTAPPHRGRELQAFRPPPSLPA